MNRIDAARNGEKYYNTGLPCKHGHTTLRYTSTGNCVECTKMYSKKLRGNLATAKNIAFVGKIKLDICVYREDEQTARDFITALNIARERIKTEELRQSLVRNGLQPPSAFGASFVPKAILIDHAVTGKPFSIFESHVPPIPHEPFLPPIPADNTGSVQPPDPEDDY